MRVTITGHTKGIGLATANFFTSKNCEISGWSRSTNNGIPEYPSTPDEHKAIFDFLHDCSCSEITILNANLKFYNVNLLYEIYEKYAQYDDGRIIIVLGSMTTEVYKSSPNIYQIQKAALELAVKQLQNLPKRSNMAPYVGLIRPGYVDTDAVKGIVGTKIDPKTIAELIWHMVETKKMRDYCIYDLLVEPNITLF